MDYIYLLAFATFALVIAFLGWNYISTKRNRETGGNVSGVGGPGDPIAGNNTNIRNPDELRASLDEAAARSPRDRVVAPADSREPH